MGVTVYLAQPSATVDPGAETTLEVVVGNSGAVVDRVDLDVVGDVGAWARCEPASVNLLPGEEATIRLVLAPPRAPDLAAGRRTFALRALSHEDTEGSVIEEATVEVGAFADVDAEVVPRTSTGRLSGRHRLAVDSLGNHPETLSVSASDPDGRVDVRLSPRNLSVEPGSAVFVRVRVRPRKRLWRGANRSLPFQLTVTPADAPPVVLPATMVQQALLPSWLPKALALVTGLAVAAVLLWSFVLKPTVESTAQAVVEDRTEQLADAIVDASHQAASAQQQAAAAQQAAGAASDTADKTEAKVNGDGGTDAEDPGTGDDGGGTTAEGTLVSADAVDFRISTAVPVAGGYQDEEYRPGAKRVVWVSDIVLQNPAGDAGTLRIRRGDTVLLEFGLQNFRDLDYHFIQPAQFDRDHPVIVSVDCTNDTTRPCRAAVFFSGQQVKTTTRNRPAADG